MTGNIRALDRAAPAFDGIPAGVSPAPHGLRLVARHLQRVHPLA